MSAKRMALSVGSVETKRPRQRFPAESLHRKPPLSAILASLSTPLHEIAERARALSMSWEAMNVATRSSRSGTSSGSLQNLRTTLAGLSGASQG